MPHAELKKQAQTLIDGGKTAEAIEILERLRDLEPDNRPVLLQLVRLLAADKNPIRAGKWLQGFLRTHPGEEHIQNMLGGVLTRVQNWNAAYESLEDFYQHYDEQLNRLRNDGQKRWGMLWLPAVEADIKWESLRRAKREYLAAQAAHRKAEKNLQDLIQQRADALSRVNVGGQFRGPDIESFDREIYAARGALDSAGSRWVAAQSRFGEAQPTFPP